MKVELLEIDKSTVAAKIYPKKVVEKAIPTNKNLFVEFPTGNSMSLDFQNCAGTVRNIRIEDDKLVGDFSCNKTPSGDNLSSLIDEEVDLNFFSCGCGNVDENEIVTNFTLSHVGVSFVPK